jgi:hypothetical protein
MENVPICLRAYFEWNSIKSGRGEDIDARRFIFSGNSHRRDDPPQHQTGKHMAAQESILARKRIIMSKNTDEFRQAREKLGLSCVRGLWTEFPVMYGNQRSIDRLRVLGSDMSRSLAVLKQEKHRRWRSSETNQFRLNGRDRSLSTRWYGLFFQRSLVTSHDQLSWTRARHALSASLTSGQSLPTAFHARVSGARR